MNKRWGFREIVVYLHGSIVVFGGLPGPHEKSEKKKRNCILSQDLTRGIECACAEKGVYPQ